MTSFTGQHAYGPNLARSPTWNKNMIVVKDLASVQQISNTPIRELVRQRIDDLGGEGFDSAHIGGPERGYISGPVIPTGV